MALLKLILSHAEWLPGVRLRHFSTTCAVYIEDCEGWWLSGGRSSVVEHWLHKPGVLGLIPSAANLLTCLYIHLVPYCPKQVPMSEQAPTPQF